MKIDFHKFLKCGLAVAVAFTFASSNLTGSKTQAQTQTQSQTQPKGAVPGTGVHITEVGDDFEDENWKYTPNLPKLHNYKDTATAKNLPAGFAINKRWFEGPKRGQPDSVRRVETPAGGLEGSTGALALKSLQTGGSYPSNVQQQDDFIADVGNRIGLIDVSRTPSVVTRVWMPPIDEWENRSGCHFAFRIGLRTDRHAVGRGILPEDFDGTYWPGMFVNLNSKEGRGATGQPHDSVYMWMKATADGRVLRGPNITETGWWTMGMSVTPDVQVHSYAKPGIEDLTEEDHIGSSYPFGYRAQKFKSFFYNICNGDDGRTWSTEFVIDDPKLFIKIPGESRPTKNASSQRRN